jgi:hypothetical protein
MNPSPCELLDGFVGQWLTEREQSAFLTHLSACLVCRQQLGEQERLNDWLLEAIAQAAPTPAGLLPKVERRLELAWRRRRAIWSAGGIAAALLIGGLSLWWLHPPTPDGGTRQTPVVEATTAALAEQSPPRRVRVTIASPSEVIAVPRKTDNPRVTIIWLYPAVQTLPREPAPPISSQPQQRRSP